MLNYLKYMIRVPRKFILNWAISGGVYLLILPLASPTQVSKVYLLILKEKLLEECLKMILR